MEQPWYKTFFQETYYKTFGDIYTPEMTQNQIEGMIALLGLKPGMRVLDLCCGFGRHTLELARRGYQVTGLDLSRPLLDRARQAARQDDLLIEWIEADMRDIPDPAQPYDAVINMFSAFGVLENDAEEAKAARAIARVLAPAGKVLIETMNRELVLRTWMPWRWLEKPDGTLILEQFRFDILTGTFCSNGFAIQPDGSRVPVAHSLRLWAYTELANLLKSSGFAETAVYGDLQAGPYTWNSERMVIVGQKSESL